MRQISEDANVACHLQYFCFISLSALGTIQFSSSFIMATEILITAGTQLDIGREIIRLWVEGLNLETVNDEIVKKLFKKWQRIQPKPQAQFTFEKQGNTESITLNGNEIAVVHPQITAIGKSSWPQQNGGIQGGIAVAIALPKVMQEKGILDGLVQSLCEQAMKKWEEIPTNPSDVPVEMVHNSDNLILVYHTSQQNSSYPPLKVTY